MPLENLEEEGLPKNPDLRIAQLKFLLTMDGHRQDTKVKTELMDAIKANSEFARFSTMSVVDIFKCLSLYLFMSLELMIDSRAHFFYTVPRFFPYIFKLLRGC